MSLELLTRAIEDHKSAVEDMKTETEGTLFSFDRRLKHLEHTTGRKSAGSNVPVPPHIKAQFEARNGGGSSFDEQENNESTLSAFLGSEQFESFKKGMPSTGRVELGRLSVRAITNEGAGGVGSTSYGVPSVRLEGLFNDPRQRLSVLSVLPILEVTGGTFEYLKLSGYSNNAAFQLLEGDEKAQTTMPTVAEQAQIATIAHWCQASVQVLADAPALQQQVTSLLRYGLLAKLESEVVAGVDGQGKIKGLVQHAVPFVPTGTPAAADAIGQAIVSLNSSGWNAGLILMNPVDWFSVASAKDTANQYILGSPRDPSPAALWGVPVVTTPSLPAGTVLVLDPAQVAVLDRMAPTLLASREANGGFTKNLVTLLAELRAGLAVFAEGAVLSVPLA